VEGNRLLEAPRTLRIPAERQRIAATGCDDARSDLAQFSFPARAVGFSGSAGGGRDAAFLLQAALGPRWARPCRQTSQVAAPKRRQATWTGTARLDGEAAAPARALDEGLAGTQGMLHWRADALRPARTPVTAHIPTSAAGQDIRRNRGRGSGNRRIERFRFRGRSTFAGSLKHSKGGENSTSKPGGQAIPAHTAGEKKGSRPAEMPP